MSSPQPANSGGDVQIGSGSDRDVELRTEESQQQWMWIAMDAKTRHIIAFHVWDRSGESGKAASGPIMPMVT